MCGRYGRWSRKERLEAMLAGVIELEGEEAPPSWNVAPGTAQPVIRAAATPGHAVIARLHWGLLPYWAKDEKSGMRPINAKCETAADKPMFRHLLRKRRCLLPADCFYEWQKMLSGKVPYAIRLASGDPFLIAGLWDVWHAGRPEALESFTIITTTPNALMAPIHDRMPVLIHPADAALWLDPSVQDPARVQGLLAPFPAEQLIAQPISSRVNNVRNNIPAVLEPAPQPESESR